MGSVEHIDGKENIVADYFSRTNPVNTVNIDTFDMSFIAKEQQRDSEMQSLQGRNENVK